MTETNAAAENAKTPETMAELLGGGHQLAQESQSVDTNTPELQEQRVAMSAHVPEPKRSMGLVVLPSRSTKVKHERSERSKILKRLFRVKRKLIELVLEVDEKIIEISLEQTL